MSINNELIDKLLENYEKPEDVIGENGLLKQLTKAVEDPAGMLVRPGASPVQVASRLA